MMQNVDSKDNSFLGQAFFLTPSQSVIDVLNLVAHLMFDTLMCKSMTHHISFC